MNQDDFLDERWNFHRDMMDGPNPTFKGRDCDGRHGGGWDWWIWEGDDFDSERARCGSCNQIVRGNPSPWAEKALEDWKNTSGFQRREYERMTERQRKAIKFDRPGWSRTWFGGGS